MSDGERNGEKYSRNIDPAAWKEIADLVREEEKQRKQEESQKKRAARKEKAKNLVGYAILAPFALVAAFSVIVCVVEGVKSLRKVLDILSYIAVLLIVCYVGSFLWSAAKRIFKKEPMKMEEYHPRTLFESKTSIVIFFLCAIGVVNLIAGSVYKSNVIGAFYERSDYNETYEATLYIDGRPIFCLAEMSRYDGEYHIREVHLPYGRSQYTDEEYDPDEAPEGISINDVDCRIKLLYPADTSSYTRLANTFTSNYGDFCAGASSDVYHFRNCYAAQNIAKENLIFFLNEKEAETFGFSMCGLCRNRY